MLHRSIIEARGDVTFPAWEGRRVYMEPFLKAYGLPDHLSSYQRTVDAMLDGIDTDQPIYLMIDETEVKAGACQRRPGLHIDGYWNPAFSSQHRSVPARHQPNPGPSHHQPTRPTPKHASMNPGMYGAHSALSEESGDWATATFDAPEAIILASTISAARGFVGTYEGAIGDMGDCAHLDISSLEILPMQAGRVYAGNVNCLHESLPVDTDCRRSLVRLNVPGWTPA